MVSPPHALLAAEPATGCLTATAGLGAAETLATGGAGRAEGAERAAEATGAAAAGAGLACSADGFAGDFFFRALIALAVIAISPLWSPCGQFSPLLHPAP
jgi:hypothetical protein